MSPVNNTPLRILDLGDMRIMLDIEEDGYRRHNICLFRAAMLNQFQFGLESDFELCMDYPPFCFDLKKSHIRACDFFWCLISESV